MPHSDTLWSPNSEHIAESNLIAFSNFVHKKYSLNFQDHESLYQWSISHLDYFWEAIADFFKVDFDQPYQKSVTVKTPFYKTQWFKGATLSYAHHIQRNFKDQKTAVIFRNELEQEVEITWNALFKRAFDLKEAFKKAGVGKGDCVAGYLLNHPDTIASFLATNALGAVWSCCSPDFGIDSIVNRFKQLNPKILLAHDAYTYNGKVFDQSQKIEQLSEQLSSLQKTFHFSGNFEKWDLQTECITDLESIPVSFDHPIWVLFSSGTTGKPKAIAHRTGGMLLEQLKALSLHQNLKEGERFFWNTTTGWMMWNYALGALLCGGVLCLYDGAATYPDLGVQWRYAQEKGIHHFGNGAPFFIQCMKEDVSVDAKKFPHLRTLGSTGAPLSEEAFSWLQSKLPHAQIISLSGGTDVCSAFLGGNPTLPVYSGYLQCRMLGAAIESWNHNGQPLWEETGELIITQPMPCMPVFFWGDTNFSQYHSSYFKLFEGVWAHGDWIHIDPQKGIKIVGRSDATLNRNGIRIGTAEIYSALDQLNFIEDHLIVEIPSEKQQGILILFVVTEKTLDTQAIQEIRTHIRNTCSPRHLPDQIVEVNEIPYTISGKKMEIPVKKIFMGYSKEQVATPGAMKNPAALDAFYELKRKFRSN